MDEIFDVNEAKRLTKKAIEDASPENLKKIQEKIVDAAKRKRWSIIVDTDLLDSYTLEELRRKGYYVSDIKHDYGDGPNRPAYDYREISWK